MRPTGWTTSCSCRYHPCRRPRTPCALPIWIVGSIWTCTLPSPSPRAGMRRIDCHAATSRPTPSSRSSRSSPARRRASSIAVARATSSSARALRSAGWRSSPRRSDSAPPAARASSGSSTKVSDSRSIDPGRHLAGGRRPAQGVGHVRFDLANAFVAVLQHALVPFRIEHTRPGFQRDLLGDRANRAFAARLVADIDRRRRAAARTPHRTADAAERVEVVIDRSSRRVRANRGSDRRHRRSPARAAAPHRAAAARPMRHRQSPCAARTPRPVRLRRSRRRCRRGD